MHDKSDLESQYRAELNQAFEDYKFVETTHYAKLTQALKLADDADHEYTRVERIAFNNLKMTQNLIAHKYAQLGLDTKEYQIHGTRERQPVS